MMKYIVIIALLLIAGACGASNQTGTVANLSVRHSDGLITFNIVGTRSAKPACATYDYWTIRDENSQSGKQQLAMLMAARLSGTQVAVTGYHACTRWGDGEAVNSLALP